MEGAPMVTGSVNSKRSQVAAVFVGSCLTIAAAVGWQRSSVAAPDDAQQGPPAPAAPGAPNLPGAEEDANDDRVSHLEEQLRELTERLKASEEQQRSNSTSRLSIHGYVDFGFFAPNGNHGEGTIEDIGNRQFPSLSGYSWTFLGDILATAVNSRGEVASLGNPPGVLRFDSVNSGGAAGFIANEVNLRIGYALTDRALMRTSVNFVPRSGRDFAMGDFIDVDQAELEYVATDDGNTSFFVGKTMPVFGIEYKERKSDQRFGITPSLVQRYTSGSQLGLKVRSKLLHDMVILAGSITNNSSGTEQFHFQSEIDRNWGKTLNGRAAISLPLGTWINGTSTDRLEIGGSGEFGTQDWDTRDSFDSGSVASNKPGNIWFLGADLQYLNANFQVKAQFIRGHAPGTTDGMAFKLDLHNSGYLEVDWMILPFAGVIGRIEQRDAFVAQLNASTTGGARAYVTKERRLTGGVRAVLNPHMTVKAEYLYNFEYGMEQIKNDIFTSSLVLSY
jgi:hypothetical protein